MTTSDVDLFEVIFGIPPSTPTIPIDPPERAEFARGAASRHRALLDALLQVGVNNGGGVLGVARGFLAEYARRSMITGRDRDRLQRIFDLLTDVNATPEGPARLQQVTDDMANDPESSAIALAVAAVAVDSATPAASFDIDPTAAIEGGAIAVGDAVGTLVGFTFGGAGGLIGGVLASLATNYALGPP